MDAPNEDLLRASLQQQLEATTVNTNRTSQRVQDPVIAERLQRAFRSRPLGEQDIRPISMDLIDPRLRTAGEIRPIPTDLINSREAGTGLPSALQTLETRAELLRARRRRELLRRRDQRHNQVVIPSDMAFIDTPHNRHESLRMYNELLYQMAMNAYSTLSARLPMYESELQHLLERTDNNVNEDGNAAADEPEVRLSQLFIQIEQANNDLPILRNMHRRSPTVEELSCLFRVVQQQYQELQADVAEDDVNADESEELEEENDVNADAIGGGGLGLANPAILGLAAAMMGAATGMGGGNMDRMMRALLQQGMPPGFLDEVVPVPMTDDDLQHMPAQKYSDFATRMEAAGAEPNEACNFCLEAFKPEDDVRCYPCCPRVAQHDSCLTDWFRSHDTCIICKTKVSDALSSSSPTPENDQTESEAH